jgi:hypothetical protein
LAIVLDSSENSYNYKKLQTNSNACELKFNCEINVKLNRRESEILAAQHRAVNRKSPHGTQQKTSVRDARE